jgi:hypothetical protein
MTDKAEKTEPTNVRLGKKLGVVHDRRTLRAGRFLDSTADIKAPPAHRIAHNLHQVPVFGNADYGDCTCASQGHRIVAEENSSGQKEIQLTDEDVLEVYSAVTGFRRDDPSTDNGAYELDVMNYMRRVGMGHEKDGTRHTIGAFAAVDWNDRQEFQDAHYVFGGLKVCAGLPISAQRQEVWDVVSGSAADWGSWGGHSMYSVGYSEKGVLLYTWGREKWATWAWIAKYVDEVYCLISEDYFKRGGRTPQGFDLARLEQALRAITA